MILSDFFNQERDRVGTTLEKMCEGLYDKSMMLKIENGKREGNSLYLSRMVNRLGIEDEMTIEYLEIEAYQENLLKNTILQNIENNQCKEARTNIKKYEKKIGNNKVALQFATAMKALIMQKENCDKQEIAKEYEKAIKYTVPAFKKKPITELLLSVQEYNLILEYYTLTDESELEKYVLELKKQLDNTIFETQSLAKIYPRMLIALSEIERSNRKIDDEELIAMGEKTLEYLSESGKNYYLYELLQAHLINLTIYADVCKATELHLVKSNIIKTKQYIMALEYIENNYNIQIKQSTFCYLYKKRECYCINDVIRNRRKMLKISRDELCENVCSKRTLLRLENKQGNTQKAIIRELLKKLHLSVEVLRTEYLTSEKNNMEIVNELDEKFIRNDIDDLEEFIKKFEKFENNNIQNKQFIASRILMQKIMKKVISSQDAIIQMKDILEYTVPYESLYEDITYFTRAEFVCLLNIEKLKSEINIENIRNLELLKQIIENEECGIYNRLSTYEILNVVYASILGNIGEYDKSNYESLKTMILSMQNNRMFNIDDNLHCIAWNEKERAKNTNNQDLKQMIEVCILLAELNGKEQDIAFFRKELLDEKY